MIKLIRESWGLNVDVVAQMKFDIPNMYKFHKQKSVDVDVDLIRIYWKKTETEEGDDPVFDKVVTEEDDDGEE
jgi:hypothetical protein